MDVSSKTGFTFESMKSFSSILIIIFLLFGCQSEGVRLKGVWIEKYTSNINANGEEYISLDQRRRILDFRNDTVLVKNFYVHFYNRESRIDTGTYSLNDQHLSIEYAAEINEYGCTITSDSLVLDFYSENPEISILRRLPEYNLGKLDSVFYEKLISSSFQILDSIRIEFNDYGEIITPSFNLNFGDQQLWTLETYGGELFLLVDGIFGLFV